jgi:hydroxylamine reductase
MSMFCFQCQETSKNQGCTVRGVCGKTADVANLQDLLIWLLKGISFYGVRARELGISDPETDLFVAQSLFATITNANFDTERLVALVRKALELRDSLRSQFIEASESLPDVATWVPEKGDLDELVQKGSTVGIMSDPDLDEDIRSLRELLTYGC